MSLNAEQFTTRWIEVGCENDNTDLAESQAPVMVKNSETSDMFFVTDIKVENHEEGSSTVWIEVEEY